MAEKKKNKENEKIEKTTKTQKAAKTTKTTKTTKSKKTNVKEEQKKEIKKVEKVENVDNNESGIEISNDVIAVIAGVAVSEVQGVASMSGGFAGGITEVLSGKKNMSKGIKVEKTENSAKIDVNIIVEYGTRIPEVAFEIQNRVKKAVESMTGFEVEEVNVHVQGVNTNMNRNEEDLEKIEKNNTEE